MKISQEDAILVKKSISVKGVWCTKAVEWIAWQRLETWKHRQRIQKTGTITRQPERVRRVTVETSCSVRSESQKSTDQLVRFHMKLPFSVQVYTG